MTAMGESGSIAAEDRAERLERLRLLVLDRLIDILENGVPVQKPDPKSGLVAEIGRAPAPPAYLSAAIRFLKDHAAATDAALEDDLSSLLCDPADFEDEDHEDDGR